MRANCLYSMLFRYVGSVAYSYTRHDFLGSGRPIPNSNKAGTAKQRRLSRKTKNRLRAK